MFYFNKYLEYEKIKIQEDILAKEIFWATWLSLLPYIIETIGTILTMYNYMSPDSMIETGLLAGGASSIKNSCYDNDDRFVWLLRQWWLYWSANQFHC